MHVRFPGSRCGQRGATLLVGMVMLLMVMLIAVGVIRLSMRHTQVVGNEQVRSEAASAANYALDLVLNSPADTWDVYRNGGAVLPVNLGLSASADGTAMAIDVRVSDLHCVRSRVLKNGELIKTTGAGVSYVSTNDSSCFGGGGTPLTIVDPTALGASNDDSLCADVLYQVEAAANDAQLLSASVAVRQGVAVRRGVDELDSCD